MGGKGSEEDDEGLAEVEGGISSITWVSRRVLFLGGYGC